MAGLHFIIKANAPPFSKALQAVPDFRAVHLILKASRSSIGQVADLIMRTLLAPHARLVAGYTTTSGQTTVENVFRIVCTTVCSYFVSEIMFRIANGPHDGLFICSIWQSWRRLRE
jgi:uncharacterized membrane protein